MVFSGVSAPLLSPPRIIHSAGRSLTEPPGLYHSALPKILTPGASAEMLGNSSSGVLPTSSVTLAPARSLIRVIMSGLLYKVGFSRPGEGLEMPDQHNSRKAPSKPSGHGWCVGGIIPESGASPLPRNRRLS